MEIVGRVVVEERHPDIGIAADDGEVFGQSFFELIEAVTAVDAKGDVLRRGHVSSLLPFVD